MFSYRVTEEYNLVANPIYSNSLQCTANNPRKGMIASIVTGEDTAVTYEEVSNIRGNKPSTSISDTLTESQLGTDV